MADILTVLVDGESHSVSEIMQEIRKMYGGNNLKKYDLSDIQRALNWLKQEKKVEFGRPPYSNKRGMGYYMI